MAREGWFAGDACEAVQKFKKAVEGGILKVMSKMGISTLESYKGAQVFQAVGLNFDLVQDYFTGTTAYLEGVGLEQIETELLEQHELAFGEKIAGNLPLDPGGELYWRRDGELHQWNPLTVGRLQHAVRADSFEAYQEFARFLNDQEERLQTIRGLLDFETDEQVPIEEVEPVEEICKPFAEYARRAQWRATTFTLRVLSSTFRIVSPVSRALIPWQTTIQNTITSSSR